MKILHISDIHLGKKLNNMSLEEDQKYWIDRFLEKTDEIQPDVIVAAGDIYDRAAPVDDAVALLDYMVTEISARKIPLVMIEGFYIVIFLSLPFFKFMHLSSNIMYVLNHLGYIFCL